MSTSFVTAADLQEMLGGIALSRIRMIPPPGMATEDDVVSVDTREDLTCELIDGVLVEKTIGYFESRIAFVIAHLVEGFLDAHDLGIGLGPDGTLCVLPGQVRAPDVAFIAWDKFPNRELPLEQIPNLVPDLAVEVLSPGNTAAEMDRKLDDYFTAGVRLVWFIDPQTESAQVYTAADRSQTIPRDGVLHGGEVLPGFELSLTDLLNRVGRRRR